MKPFKLLRPRPLRLTTYVAVIAFLVAIMFISLLSFYSYVDNQATVRIEICEDAQQNQHIIENIFNKHLDTMEAILNTATVATLDAEGDNYRHRITESLRAIYERDSSLSLDILYLQLNDGSVIDVSSPFFPSEELRETLVRTKNSAEFPEASILHCASPHTVALSKLKNITSSRSGEVIGTAVAAMVINDNLPLLEEIARETTAEGISLVWNDHLILSNTESKSTNLTQRKHTVSQAVPLRDGDYFYVDLPISIGGKTTPLFVCQKISTAMLTKLNNSLKHHILTFILLALISVAGMFYLFRYLTRRSLSTVLQLTEAAFCSPEPTRFDPTLVSEFNILGQSIVNLDHQRKKSEQQLLLSYSVFENAAEAIVITDLEGTIEQVNPACELMSGYNRAELLGGNPRLFKSNHHDADFYTTMWQALINQGQWKGEIWNRRKDGDLYQVDLFITRCSNTSGTANHYIAISHDISDIKRSEEKLHHLAYHDSLTNLPNRKLMQDRLNVAIAQAKKHETKLALIYLDIDNFKNINDLLGHHHGDMLLQQMGQRLIDCIRHEDTAARIGGDEFIILMPQIHHNRDITILCNRIIEYLEEPYLIAEKQHTIHFSIGITIYPDDANSAEDLIKKADIAMYRVKETGKNGYQFFTSSMHEAIMKRIEFESRISNALHNNEFILFFQPQVDLASEQVIGAEVLIRWQHPDGTLIYPDDFIHIAEECGLIQEIDYWVLQQACDQGYRWQQQGHQDIKLSVNLSSVQFNKDKELVNRVRQILYKTGYPPNLLTVEITENAVMADTTNAINVMHQLRDLGITIAIDDFGTGYSSLSYVKNFPASYLKIDRSFVKDIPYDTDDMAIAASIIALAKNLRMEVIAEGVETQNQCDFLNLHQCQQVQGYFYGKPVDADTFKSTFLRSKNNLENNSISCA